MDQPAYQVQLPSFTGPLDLLLHLIEQKQLDITAIALAQVTDQYLTYLRAAQTIIADDLTEFLVIAARLLLLKSRILLPKPPQEFEESDDIGEDLVRQLREYKRFKQVAEFLEQRDQASLHMYLRMLPPAKRTLNREPKLDLSETSLDDMIAALKELLREQEATDEFKVVPHHVTISQKIAHIHARLQTQPMVTFDSLLDNAHSRVEIIVTLLAVLEMVRSKRVQVQQERLFGPIRIWAVEAPESTSLPSLPIQNPAEP
jgi:segregation and condensation protein A